MHSHQDSACLEDPEEEAFPSHSSCAYMISNHYQRQHMLSNVGGGHAPAEVSASTLGIAVAGQAWTGAEDQYGEVEATRYTHTHTHMLSVHWEYKGHPSWHIKSSRYVEDPMKIRGSAGRRQCKWSYLSHRHLLAARLGCLRRVLEKLSTNLKADMERTAQDFSYM
eukprot:6461221-Amphidinium_carterae.1